MKAEWIDTFQSLLASRFGWRFEDDRRQLLADALTVCSRGASSIPDYLERLAQASDRSEDVRTLAGQLAVSETYFFRNQEQFAVLGSVALPAAVRRHPHEPIRILSAGSASGEEAYSIAITVWQLQQRQSLPHVEILGLDISSRVIDKARAGHFSRWALRGLEEGLVRNFFDERGGYYELLPGIRSMVRFEERNLADPHLPLAADSPWDIVFFRNTCMYFTAETARDIVGRIAAAMTPGGHLFLGHAENLRGLSDAFDLHHTHQTFYYVRRPDEPASHPQPAVTAPAAAPRQLPPEQGHVSGANDSWFHAIGRATERVAAIIGQRPADEAAAVPESRPPQPSIAVALALMSEERHEEALHAVGGGELDADRLLLRAVLLANLGRVSEARQASHLTLGADAFNAGAHYVLALCAEREGELALAVAHDETAVYLDATFAMPHLHMGLLTRRMADAAAAGRHFRAARDLLGREDASRIMLFGGGFSRQALIQVCETQMGEGR
jgi:chemotaxis protein methyltransferase CheR